MMFEQNIIFYSPHYSEETRKIFTLSVGANAPLFVSQVSYLTHRRKSIILHFFEEYAILREYFQKKIKKLKGQSLMIHCSAPPPFVCAEARTYCLNIGKSVSWLVLLCMTRHEKSGSE